MTEEVIKDVEWGLNEITHNFYKSLDEGKQEYDTLAIRDMLIEGILRMGYKVEIEEVRTRGANFWYPCYRIVKA